MRTILATIMLCGTAGSAAAADNGVYIGAGVTRSSFNLDGALDGSDTGYKIIAGVRLLDSFGVEANYVDHGKALLPSGIACIALVGVNCPDTLSVGAKTAAVYAVGFLDFPLLDLFGKAGVSTSSSRLRTLNLPAIDDKDSSTNFAWGTGAQLHFGSLGVRAEFEQIKIIGNDKLNTTSLSFVYTLL